VWIDGVLVSNTQNVWNWGPSSLCGNPGAPSWAERII
jgi:hypothetical protein